jgi:hypothetical protein
VQKVGFNATTCVAGCAAEPEWERLGMRNKDTQSWGQEDCTFLVGYVSAYLIQSGYFIGQYKEMNQVKIKLQQFLDLR